MLPTVDFCGLNPTRLILGANPFGGFSHQGKARNKEMREYYTVEKIKDAWAKAEAAGINTMVTNNETPKVIQAVEEYLGDGGKLQWIAQLNTIRQPSMIKAIDQAAEIGCVAVYFHGMQTEKLYVNRDSDTLKAWVDHAHDKGVLVGAAGHTPAEHLWANEFDVLDFHNICFFNCGSLHEGRGEKFHLSDMPLAVAAAREIEKPCIGYKIMGCGRIDPETAFQHAFDQLKPIDIVNIGMHLGDNENMIEENVAHAMKFIG